MKQVKMIVIGMITLLVVMLISGCGLSNLPVGEYKFSGVVYVGGISSATADELVRRKATTEYRIGETFLRIADGSGSQNFTNITYKREKLTDSAIKKSYNVEDTTLMAFFNQFKQRYRYRMLDSSGAPISYYIFQMDDQLFISQYAKLDSLIFSIDQLSG